VLKSRLEIARSQWPKAGHILEMAGEIAAKVKKWQVKFYRYISFHLLSTTLIILDHLVD
jgi:hypothetical protein